jgi:ketosteroid isomerase-like protein
MSQNNVEIVREYLDRFAGGDWDAWRRSFAPDIVWDTSASAMPWAGVYHGHEGAERFMVEWLGAWRDPVVENLELIDGGDSVVSVFRWSGRGKASGIEAAETFFAVYDLEEGLITRFRAFRTRDEALQAAGLAE